MVKRETVRGVSGRTPIFIHNHGFLFQKYIASQFFGLSVTRFLAFRQEKKRTNSQSSDIHRTKLFRMFRSSILQVPHLFLRSHGATRSKLGISLPSLDLTFTSVRLSARSHDQKCVIFKVNGTFRTLPLKVIKFLVDKDDCNHSVTSHHCFSSENKMKALRKHSVPFKVKQPLQNSKKQKRSFIKD